MKKTLTIGLSAIALTITGAAFAQQSGGEMKAKPDMTRAQAQAKADERFAKMDANNDGVVTDADREARKQAMRTKMFDGLDTDKNGQISREEFMNFKHEGKRGMGKGEQRGHWGKRHGGGMKGMADANNDGSISKAEFTAASLARFDNMDANNDGTVTSAERKAAREAMKAQWRAKKAEKAN